VRLQPTKINVVRVCTSGSLAEKCITKSYNYEFLEGMRYEFFLEFLVTIESVGRGVRIRFTRRFPGKKLAGKSGCICICTSRR